MAFQLSYQESPCLSAAAAAKSPQSCPTLCDPIDGSLLGFPVPGILQARTLEWVAIVRLQGRLKSVLVLEGRQGRFLERLCPSGLPAMTGGGAGGWGSPWDGGSSPDDKSFSSRLSVLSKAEPSPDLGPPPPSIRVRVWMLSFHPE